jgi:hypothetical protein
MGGNLAHGTERALSSPRIGARKAMLPLRCTPAAVNTPSMFLYHYMMILSTAAAVDDKHLQGPGKDLSNLAPDKCNCSVLTRKMTLAQFFAFSSPFRPITPHFLCIHRPTSPLFLLHSIMMKYHRAHHVPDPLSSQLPASQPSRLLCLHGVPSTSRSCWTRNNSSQQESVLLPFHHEAIVTMHKGVAVTIAREAEPCFAHELIYFIMMQYHTHPTNHRDGDPSAPVTIASVPRLLDAWTFRSLSPLLLLLARCHNLTMQLHTDHLKQRKKLGRSWEQHNHGQAPHAHPQDWPCAIFRRFELNSPGLSSLFVHFPARFPSFSYDSLHSIMTQFHPTSHHRGDPHHWARQAPLSPAAPLGTSWERDHHHQAHSQDCPCTTFCLFVLILPWHSSLFAHYSLHSIRMQLLYRHRIPGEPGVAIARPGQYAYHVPPAQSPVIC